MSAMLSFSCINLVQMLCFLLMIFTCISLASKVTHLPGFDGPLPFHLETGYVTVDNESGSEYFYYFVESERNPNEDPLILWLIGGPYCSGFVGLAMSMGPLNMKGDAYDDTFPTLVYNPYAWTKISSIIFLDWPVGTGFSFSRNADSYSSSDLQSSKEIYRFLKEWLLLYPHFLSNPLYIGGDSYGGKMVPVVTKEIVQGNEGQNHSLFINIKGYLVGNGVTVDSIDLNAHIYHAQGLGIISDEIFERIVQSCKENKSAYSANLQCEENLKTYFEILSGINLENILKPYCSEPLRATTRSTIDKSKDFLHLPTLINDECSQYAPVLAYIWASNRLSREALHIKEGTVEKWLRCREDYRDNYTYNIQNVASYHSDLTTLGYRALVYSGDHDLMVPFVGTLQWIKSLNFTVKQGWRSWHVARQVAGYTILFSNNFTFATILGGSHLAAANRPMQCFSMFERWMSHKLL